MAESPEQVMRDAYEALARGDIPAVVALMNPAIEWHEPGLRGNPPPASGKVYLGLRSVQRDVLEALGASWDGFTVSAEDYLSSGERVVVTGHYRATARGTDRRLDVAFVHICTVRDGKLCRLEASTDTAKVLHALGTMSAQ